MQEHRGQDPAPSALIDRPPRHKAPVEEKPLQRGLRGQQEPIGQKDQHIQRDQQAGDIGHMARRVVIADRKHGLRLGDRRARVKRRSGGCLPPISCGDSPRGYLPTENGKANSIFCSQTSSGGEFAQQRGGASAPFWSRAAGSLSPRTPAPAVAHCRPRRWCRCRHGVPAPHGPCRACPQSGAGSGLRDQPGRGHGRARHLPSRSRR